MTTICRLCRLAGTNRQEKRGRGLRSPLLTECVDFLGTGPTEGGMENRKPKTENRKLVDSAGFTSPVFCFSFVRWLVVEGVRWLFIDSPGKEGGDRTEGDDDASIATSSPQ